MRVPFTDRLLFGAALAVALASAGWFGWRAAAIGRISRPGDAWTKTKPIIYAPQIGDPDFRVTVGWLSPVAQPRGEGWTYDAFTPPEIYYDEGAGEFAVNPAVNGKGVIPADMTAGLELVSVRRVPFPLQLLGYVVGDDRIMGSFEDDDTGQVFLAAAGRKLPALGIEIVDFAVLHRPGATVDSSQAHLSSASALVRDSQTGHTVTLTAGERSYTDDLVAIIAMEEDDGETVHELRRGEELHGRDRTYTIERIEFDPAVVGIVMTTEDSPQPVRMELNPRIVSTLPALVPAE